MILDDSLKNKLLNFLDEKEIKIEKNFDLRKKSWLKAGGVVKNYIEPSNYEQIIQLVKFFKENNLDYFVVGNLSNIIFRDGKIVTPIINIKNYNDLTLVEDSDKFIVNASCGISIFKFITYVSQKLKISGLEGLVGIPGSLGGGIYMNASSYESYISEYLKEIKYVNFECQEITIKKEDAKLEWRSSIFHNYKNIIILNALFEFPKNNLTEIDIINKNIEKVKRHRITFQEKKFPNLGSLFATKDLYKDISSSRFLFKVLYFLNIIITKLIRKFLNENYLIKYRKFIVGIYSLILGINKHSSFKLSDRTINCLINNDSTNANEAIKIIRNYQKKIKYSQKLENIILEDIL
jgi:UDP-N-acetylmuramate dehydrogenase